MPDVLRRDLEALLFAAGRPLDVPTLVSALGSVHGQAVTAAEVEAILAGLTQDYPVDGPRGLELAQVGGGWTFRTNRLSEAALSALFDLPEDTRLSPAALETLAIVAYLQPVTRPQIAEIRGVNADSAVQTLVDRDLVTESGRDPGPGGAVLYGTTERFLVAFGLARLSDLPPIEEFMLTPERREELRRRLLAAVTGE